MEKLVFGNLASKDRIAAENKGRALFDQRVDTCAACFRHIDELPPLNGPLAAYPEHIRHHGLAVIHAAAARVHAERTAATRKVKR